MDWLRRRNSLHLATIDFAPRVKELACVSLSDDDRSSAILGKRLNAHKHLYKADKPCRVPKGLAEFVKQKHLAGTQTLIVVNTVDRAREIFDELNKVYGKSGGKAGGKA